MKNRNVFTNILSIIILVALIFFLLIQFNVFKVADSVKNMLVLISLGVAVVSVILMDIVFPIIDNKHRLAEKKYVILFVVKLILFAAAVVSLLLFHPFNVIEATPALIAFIVLYFAQFFINLDAKPASDSDEEEEDEKDEKEEKSETGEFVDFRKKSSDSEKNDKNTAEGNVEDDSAKIEYSDDKTKPSAVLDMDDIDDLFKEDK